MKTLKILIVLLLSTFFVPNTTARSWKMIIRKAKAEHKKKQKAKQKRIDDMIASKSANEQIGWLYDMPVERKFRIQSAINYGKTDRGFFDASGYGDAEENLEVNKKGEGKDRFYTLEQANSEMFYIHPSDDVYISVDVNNGTIEDGANLQLMPSDESEGQQFSFYHVGGGKFRISASSSSYVISAEDKRTLNGNNLLISSNEDGIYQEWYLLEDGIPYVPYKN